MRCCGNCEYVKLTKSLLSNEVLPIGTCRLHPPMWVNIKSAWLYPNVEIGNQACSNYKIKGE
jgi:hypothetical protein